MSAVSPSSRPDKDAAVRWKAAADFWKSLAVIAALQNTEFAELELKAVGIEALRARAENARLMVALAKITGDFIDPPDDPDDLETMTDAQRLQHIARKAYYEPSQIYEVNRDCLRRVGDLIRGVYDDL